MVTLAPEAAILHATVRPGRYLIYDLCMVLVKRIGTLAQVVSSTVLQTPVPS